MPLLDRECAYDEVYDGISRSSQKAEFKNLVAQQVKLLFTLRAPHIRILLRVPAVLLLIQLHENAPGKAEDASKSTWAPATHVGDLHGVLGSWLQSGPALVVAN